MTNSGLPAGAIDLDRLDLDGHSIEDLSDYLDSGRSPYDPHIEESAGCRIALDALSRLQGLGMGLLAADTAGESATDEGWVQRILSGIARDARAGRRIPLAVDVENADLGITEGAVRGIIRDAENDVPGVLAGRCSLDGEVTVPGGPVRISVDISVRYGLPLSATAELLRAAILRRLASHTELRVVGVDVRVNDVHGSPEGGAA